MVRRIRHRTGRGTSNRYDGRLDYELPPPWDTGGNITSYSSSQDLLAVLSDSATSIPLEIIDEGNPAEGDRDDDGDGNPYDVLFWDVDGTDSFGFEQEIYIFREPTPPTASAIQNIPISPNSPIKSLVIIIEDFQSAPVRQAVFTGRPVAETAARDIVVYNGENNDVVFGLEAEDDLFGGAGNDLINGGSEFDRLVGNSGDDQLYGEAGGDALHGLEGKDFLYGGSSNDALFGGAGDDTVYGGTGNDGLAGDAGSDTLVGGSGNDTYRIASDTSDTIIELAGEGADTVETELSYTLPTHVERLILQGASAVIGTGNNLDNIIEDRPIDSFGETPSVNNTINAGAGDDIVSAGAGSDTVNGNDGNDTLLGGQNTDTLTGGAGADQFVFRSSSGSYFPDADGIDNITDFNVAQGDKLAIPIGSFSGGLSVGTLPAAQFHVGAAPASPSHRFIYNPATGAFFFDFDGTAINPSFGVSASPQQIATLSPGLSLTSNAIQVIDGFSIPELPVSPPVLVAGSNLSGTAGSDRLLGSEGNDTISLLAGDDLGSGQEGNDTINGGDGKDFLEGGSGNDQIFGESGSDRLLGEAGSDVLNGGSENDTLYGGTGNDGLTGGVGEDRFHFYDPAIDGIDQITDFNVAEDKIGIYIGGDSAYSDAGLTPNVPMTAAQFQLGATATNSNTRFLYNSTTGALFFDVDGNGATAQVQIASLSPGLALTAGNLLGFDNSNSTAPDSGTPTRDVINGGSTDDTINGLGGNDTLDGGDGNDRLSGGGGNDTLKGGAGRDTLLGLGSNDVLSGEVGNDRLEGGNGKDKLFGGPGSDRLFGGSGRDIFVLERGAGRDRIEDFQNGVDRLGLTPGLRFPRLTIQRKGQNTLIRLGNDPLALLVDVSANQITRADFVSVQPI